ncbi:hypothetical protein ACGFIX_34830 [Nocardia salmonicida]|uniref:hypothetical protein n=1 Tax=Nocardia salmonicida TaxID=53431 RepID=UPI003717D499
MMKTLAALALVALAASVVGCSSGDSPATPTTTTTAAVDPPTTSSVTMTSAVPVTTAGSAPASALRSQTCRDMLPLLDTVRATDPAAANDMAATTISNLAESPEWPSLTEADRAATIAGVRDAAAGSCE